MNNEQFRRLLQANSTAPKADKDGASPPAAARPAGSSTPGGGRALGSKMRSSIPMTPRSVAGARGPQVDFAKQLAERNQVFDRIQKKARTSAPKGSKLAQGYVDRAKTRQEQDEDERAERLRALEESLKKDEIDRATYDRLRSEIAGGDLSSTHLVKGLDFKLLERIRKGEDVYSGKPESSAEGQEEEEPEEDADDALERLEAAEVEAITKEKVQKKGQLAPASLNPGQKRSRNQILAEMKAAREAAAKAKQESALGSKFKKIGAKKAPGTRIERDSKGREVMIIVDEDGHERRKVRKVGIVSHEEQEREREALALASGSVLGMEVPEFYKKQLAEQEAEEETDGEIRIFDDAGSDYDPLAGLEGSDDDSSDEEGAIKEPKAGEAAGASATDMPPPPKPAAPDARNYFRDSKTSLTSAETYKTPSLDDPTLMAALKKAKAISAAEKSEEEQKAAERERRLREKLQASNRDDDDLDMGFGSSRVEDEADGDDTAKVKLSEWKGGDDDGDDDGEGGDGGGDNKSSKRKRGPKKRKGDKNSFADVMRVMERNKSGG